MATTFTDLIDQNKRNSILLMMIVSFVVIVFGGVIGGVIGSDFGGGYNDLMREAGVSEADPGGDWQVHALWGMLIATAAVVVLLVFSFYGGGQTVLAISRARPIDKADDPQLFNVVEEMAIAAGVPMPKIYLIDDTAPNAFATGRDPEHAAVAITQGLRSKLTRDELQGVMAHEMSHVRNYDIRFAMLMGVLVGVIVLLADFFIRYAWLGGGRSRRSSGGSGGGAAVLILFLIALILSLIAPLIAKVIQLAVSRQREYLADASAIELTRNPDGLAGALKKIAGDKEVLEVANRATQHLYIVNPIKPFEKRAKSLFSTHPPVQERIRRILSLNQ